MIIKRMGIKINITKNDILDITSEDEEIAYYILEVLHKSKHKKPNELREIKTTKKLKMLEKYLKEKKANNEKITKYKINKDLKISYQTMKKESYKRILYEYM